VTLYPFLRPLLFAFDAETAHGLSLRALKAGLIPAAPAPDARLRCSLLGRDFASPLGLAAGYDKNGEAIAAALALGFGFVEVGSVTPRPQSGNPRPRLFRLDGDRAVINRLGFNNDGFDAVHARLAQRPSTAIVGVNVGANRDSADRAADYAAGVARFADIADYIAINVSSPNTPGLRALQEHAALVDLLARVNAARAAAPRRPPLLLKIAPDLDEAALARVVEAATSAGIDGLIVANTTLARDGIRDARADEAGGLSGRPLFRRSTVMLAKVRRMVGKAVAIIGVGGVDSADTAWEKFAAGADLVELYTGMVFEGPRLPAQVNAGLAARLDREGIATIGAVVGSQTDRWAAMGG
jgi:dihydroorotate dehydrogenase